MFMIHAPSQVSLADYIFDGYLAKEELAERQTTGRHWDLVISDGYYELYILLDNDTVLHVATPKYGNKGPVRSVEKRDDIKLPTSLHLRYYD